jgi:hypothetical protein
MSKYYFYNVDSEMCETLEFIKEKISRDNLTEKEVYNAKRMVGQGVFYCKKYMECGEVGESCGVDKCDDYKPRNGKSGRCTNSENCYEVGDKILIKL